MQHITILNVKQPGQLSSDCMVVGMNARGDAHVVGKETTARTDKTDAGRTDVK